MIAGLVFVVAYAVAFKILATGAEVQSAPSPPVKESLQRVCVTCHALEQITSSRRSRSQWEDLINRMIERGAKGTDEEFTVVFDYLVGQYGRVNVNTATADEMAQVLGLPAKEAESIVTHRQTNGKFDGFDALMKVPDVDREKLERSRDAISF
jgi:competence ComEA-like helix-hairpin-helix protein